MSEIKKKLDLAAVRERLERARGREFWRSLEDLAQTDDFVEMMHREFPRYASEWPDGASRRNFIKLMGASMALAGLTACTRQPTEQIMPYVKQPEEVIPGRPLFFATAMPWSGTASGLLVESHEGRPTKVEGNPAHPASLGACDLFSQASVLQLYDPDRSQALTFETEIRSWPAFLGSLREQLAAQKAKNGAGLRILTETVNSPTMADQLKGILAAFPAAKWHQWEPAGAHSGRAAAAAAFGQPVNTYYNFLNADVIVSLDADFLASEPNNMRYAREFAAKRRVRGNQTAMSRLYVVETMPSPTGTKADHRLPVRAHEVEKFAVRMAAALGVNTGGREAERIGPFEAVMGPLMRDIQAHPGAAVVVPGACQPPAVHALAHAINERIGAVGKTVFYTDPVEANPVDQVASLHDLANDLNAGAVDLLLILEGNPVYTAPAELDMATLIQKARMTVRLGLYDDETSAVCRWHLPASHFLEAWADTRTLDGTVSIMQPLIAPLYESRSAIEVLAMLGASPEATSYEIVRGYWSRQHPGADFETWWRRSLHDGIVANTALPAKAVAVRGIPPAPPPQAPQAHTLEVCFRPDPTIYDGRYANLGWQQELPKPICKLTWDNAALMSPGTAHRLGVENNDVVELRYRGRKVRGSVWIQPGHADESVTVYLGYGRTRGGHTMLGAGFNAYLLRTSAAPWHDFGLDVVKTGDTYTLASTQDYHVLDTRRNVVRVADIADYRKNPDITNEGAEIPPKGLTLYPQYKYEGYAWGMTIDLTSCTGCQGCVVACVAENNIPVVGKDQVLRHRDMQWLRVDSYYTGGLENPEIYNQPVPCMQCEDAPCELVCPVQATSHSSEGLNDMVYNRCVGTRYCSNNCPYKVRRFNFYLFNDWAATPLTLLHNPDVTVRSRGVMEKCTYCVQRINAAKMDAEREDRKVRDGDIQTACQAACPTEAIVFGDINDPNSRVSLMKAEKMNYGLLAELNTRPRTTYLASLRNPNPEVES